MSYGSSSHRQPACASIDTLTFTHTRVEVLGGARSQFLEAIKQKLSEMLEREPKNAPDEPRAVCPRLSVRFSRAGPLFPAGFWV